MGDGVRNTNGSEKLQGQAEATAQQHTVGKRPMPTVASSCVPDEVVCAPLLSHGRAHRGHRAAHPPRKLRLEEIWKKDPYHFRLYAALPLLPNQVVPRGSKRQLLQGANVSACPCPRPWMPLTSRWTPAGESNARSRSIEKIRAPHALPYFQLSLNLMHHGSVGSHCDRRRTHIMCILKQKSSIQ